MSIVERAKQELEREYETAFIESAKILLHKIDQCESRIEKENSHIEKIEAEMSKLNKRDKSALFKDPSTGCYTGTSIHF